MTDMPSKSWSRRIYKTVMAKPDATILSDSPRGINGQKKEGILIRINILIA
jgi:hypothetical protein